jgi:uncharacterized repeat protein (TIGR01451 family)
VDSTPGNSNAGEDDQASVNVDGQQIDLSLTKTVNNATPQVGQNVTFTITLSNSNAAGIDTATGVTVMDALPAGLTFVSSSSANGSYDSGTGLWTLASGIAPGGSATLTIVATVTSPVALTNMAQVQAANQPDVDSTPGNSNAGEDDQASMDNRLISR